MTVASPDAHLATGTGPAIRGALALEPMAISIGVAIADEARIRLPGGGSALAEVATRAVRVDLTLVDSNAGVSIAADPCSTSATRGAAAVGIGVAAVVSTQCVGDRLRGGGEETQIGSGSTRGTEASKTGSAALHAAPVRVVATPFAIGVRLAAIG